MQEILVLNKTVTIYLYKVWSCLGSHLRANASYCHLSTSGTDQKIVDSEGR